MASFTIWKLEGLNKTRLQFEFIQFVISEVQFALSQPEGISAKENVIKECDEEASIPFHLAKK